MDATYADVKEAYYQAQFTRVIALAEVPYSADASDRLRIDLVKIQAAQELHETEKVKQWALEVASDWQSSVVDFETIFLKARVFLLQRDFTGSLTCFRDALKYAETIEQRFHTEIGLVASYTALEQFDMCGTHLQALRTYKSETSSKDLQILYCLAQGNFCRHQGRLDAALANHSEALKLSFEKPWKYFIQRSLYEIGRTSLADQNSERLHYAMSMLRSNIDPRQSRYLLYLINRDFSDQHYEIGSTVSLCKRTVTAKIGDIRHDFSRSILLFDFLEILAGKDDFISKDKIAELLWSNENYKPHVHDLRIYNLVSRLRDIFERNQSQPILFLSGPKGYKLAKRDPESIHVPIRVSELDRPNNLQSGDPA